MVVEPVVLQSSNSPRRVERHVATAEQKLAQSPVLPFTAEGNPRTRRRAAWTPLTGSDTASMSSMVGPRRGLASSSHHSCCSRRSRCRRQARTARRPPGRRRSPGSHTRVRRVNQTSAKHEAGHSAPRRRPASSAPTDGATAVEGQRELQQRASGLREWCVCRARHGLPAPVRQYWHARARRTCSIRLAEAWRGARPRRGTSGGRAAAPSPEALAAAESRAGEARWRALGRAARQWRCGAGGAARWRQRTARPHQKISQF